ncbi:MAG: LysR family transcriptional regulator [Synergistaceae bacterium]|nr:LysR family transcriptional regulator [Synergistaceae bacterium]
MNTLHLKYALEVEKTGSITKAADRLYMNQPHLSKTIRDLEGALGSAIFKRTPKGMVPTKKGAEFLAGAKNILAQLEKMESLFAGEDSQRASLRITVPRASYISHAFTEFIKSLPEGVKMDVDYRETNSVRAMENVMEGHSDLGVIRFQSDYTNYFESLLAEKNLRFEPVREFEYLVLFSGNHPLAKCDVVECAKLRHYAEVTHGDSTLPSAPPRRGKDAPQGGEGGEIAIYERGSQFEILNSAQTTYMWVSPMPSEVLARFSLVQRKSDAPNNRHRDFLISRDGYRFSKEDDAFAEKLREIVENTETRT